jgi:CDP-paratose 2-epimerase
MGGMAAAVVETGRHVGPDRVSVAVVTGAGGLIGAETARRFGGLGLHVVGIDNDMRGRFFGAEASTAAEIQRLERDLGAGYTHHHVDIRDRDSVAAIFRGLGTSTAVVIHAAAQPSHDWAAGDPFTDFDINAVGTLNVLQAAREHCIDAPFVFCSTNKVYGDRPNELPLEEQETRWEVPAGHPAHGGIGEDMAIDATLHSVFGASKVAADVLVQEYGRYFGMRTACFRGGTLTGPAHRATELHGFLAYIVRCTMERRTYNLFGYKGKQVRDAIHAHDVAAAFEAFFRQPRSAEIYNLGGGRHANASNLEAIALAEQIVGQPLEVVYKDEARVGDHRWWIGSNARFEGHYPGWELTYDVPRIMQEIHDANVGRWTST